MKFKDALPEFNISQDAKFIIASFFVFVAAIFSTLFIFDLWHDWTVAVVTGISVYLSMQLIVYMKWGSSN